MAQKLLTILFLVLLPGIGFAQQSKEDPFKRDPFFTKSLDEFFGAGDQSEEGEKIVDTERAIKRVSNTGIDLGGSFEAGPYYSNSLYSQYPNLPMIHYNRVNGLFLGIRRERMQWQHRGGFLKVQQIYPHGFIGYGTASKEWEYSIGLEKLFGEERRFMIGGEYYKATSTEDYNRTGLIENSLTSFFGAYDFMDYQKMEGFGIYSVFRTARWVEAAFSYNNDRFNSLEQNTSYSLFGRSGTYRPNSPIDLFSDEIDLDRYSASLSFNPRNVLLTDRFTFSASLAAELADNSDSDFDYRYNKYWSTLKVFYNFEPGSILRWRMNAGGITGNAPDFKDFYLGGIGTLRGSPFKYFRGNQMLASNLEVQFGTPSSRAGEWIRDYNLHLLFFLDSGWTRDIPELRTGSDPTAGFKEFSFSEFQHDAGVGIGTGAFRFEVAWPLKEFESTPAFWIRLNPTF